jgi:hypothetical protein
MRRCLWSLFAVALFGCGSDPVEPPPASSCGVGGTASGQECTGLKQCGRGESNYVEVAFCEHCFARPDTHVCEAGVCRQLPMELGTLKVAFTLDAVQGAQSFAQATILPTMADGTKVTCAALLSTCNSINNPAINTTLSNAKALPGGGDVVISLISADPGPDRLYMVRLTSELQGKGQVKAVGCKEGITVVAGQTVDVSVDLVAQ